MTRRGLTLIQVDAVIIGTKGAWATDGLRETTADKYLMVRQDWEIGLPSNRQAVEVLCDHVTEGGLACAYMAYQAVTWVGRIRHTNACLVRCICI